MDDCGPRFPAALVHGRPVGRTDGRPDPPRETNGGKVHSVREYIGTFPGLTATARQKAVYAAAGISAAGLRDLWPDGVPDADQFSRLHAAMCAAVDPPGPKKLGVIGREAMTAGLATSFRVDDGGTKYQARLGTSGGLPSGSSRSRSGCGRPRPGGWSCPG